jgi:hypothetical protein
MILWRTWSNRWIRDTKDEPISAGGLGVLLGKRTCVCDMRNIRLRVLAFGADSGDIVRSYADVRNSRIPPKT